MGDEMKMLGTLIEQLSASGQTVDEAIASTRVRLRRLEILKRMAEAEAPKKHRRRKSAGVSVSDTSAVENGGAATP